MSAAPVRIRPIFGGVFGSGRYALATSSCIANGLHAVRFMVIEPRAGSVLSIAENKLDALASARKLLRAAGVLAREAANDEHWVQGHLWTEEAQPMGAGTRVKAVPRRRREVFERSGGRCHYCSTVLTLDGRWHVEHMVPRALLGTSNPDNLVAACVACNLAKGDRTALEFVTTRAQSAGSTE